jgi:uncharacterized protein YqeY
VGQAQEHPRLVLSSGDVDQIIRAEIADREHTIAQYESAGRDEAADELRAEIRILERYAR